MKKLRIAVAALVIAAGSFATFAFTNANTGETKAQNFRYVGNDTSPGAFADINNWEPGSSTDPTCGLDDKKPCQHSAIDETDLAAQLSGLSNTAVLNMVDITRQ